MSASNLLSDLAAIVGQPNVLTSDADRSFYAMDVYNQLELPLAVVQPATVDELQKAVRAITSAGVAVVPRGGGASYTDGYLPTTTNSILLDTSRLNRIVEINATDMYVTVEPGLTWAELWQATGEAGTAHDVLGAVFRDQGDRRRFDVPEQREPRFRQLRCVSRCRAGLRYRAGEWRDPQDQFGRSGERRAVFPLVRTGPHRPVHR